MTEIVDIFKVRAGSGGWWLILNCGHWYKWTGPKVPKVGAYFRCPDCQTIRVEFPAEQK